MLTMRAITTRITLPPNIAVGFLEAGIALTAGGYIAYLLHGPLARALSNVFAAHTAGLLAIAVMSAVVLPLLCMLFGTLMLTVTRPFRPNLRAALDVVLLAILITTLTIPTARELFNSAHPEQQDGSAIWMVATGALNVAPAPLKLERIPLGAELWNTGTHPVDVNVWFVTLNERGRTYCAGTPLVPGVQGRSRISAGERLVFTSGNCQRGSVGLTVWDASGKRVYQTSVVTTTAE